MIPLHRDNTLNPFGNGFHFSAPPPADVGALKHLTGSDPDAVICAVLARAQEGEFYHTQQLVRIMQENDLGWVWSDCSALLSHAAPASVLESLICAFSGHIANHVGSTIGWIIEILAESTLLGWVPTIIDLHGRMLPDDRLRHCGVVNRLSFMLEPQAGSIAQGPEDLLVNPGYKEWEDPVWSYDFPSFERMLMIRAVGLGLDGRGHQAFFRGEPLSLESLAELMLEKVRRNRNVEIVATGRMLLDAYTGRNFTGFYDLEADRLDPIVAAAMLEDLLESKELDRFEPGVRHFFGHRIPA